jgi:hypothetical protein
MELTPILKLLRKLKQLPPQRFSDGMGMADSIQYVKK